MARLTNRWLVGLSLLTLVAGLARVSVAAKEAETPTQGPKKADAVKMEEPKDPTERKQLKCDIRTIGVNRLVKVFTNEGDGQGAVDVLRLLEVQNRITMTRQFAGADVETVLEVLKGKTNDLVRCRALATVGAPLAGKMLTPKDRARFNKVVAEHLNHSSAMVRKTALQLITGFGNPEDFPAVERLTKDEDPLVQKTAKGAVAVFKKAKIVP